MPPRPRHWLHVLSRDVAAALLVVLAGCTTDFAATQARPAQDGEDGVSWVTVRFRNLTDADAVNVEFYATNQPLANLPDDLFVAEHLVTRSVGVAGTAILQPRYQDSIEFPCTGDLTLGTFGGNFLDNATGEPRGVGTPRWAQEGPLALCGSTVTFDFSGGNGAFTTILNVGG